MFLQMIIKFKVMVRLVSLIILVLLTQKNSMKDLSDSLAKVRSTEDFAEFASVAKDIRVNVNAELVQFVKNFNGE
jgi:hypothetical protein